MKIKNRINKSKLMILKTIGNLLFFKRHSNLFFVLLNWRKKHLITLSSGFCKLGKTKKQKIAPLNMFMIIEKLKNCLELYNIKFLRFYIRQRYSFYFNKLRKLFKFYNISIIKYRYILRRRHGKIRKRKIRRV